MLSSTITRSTSRSLIALASVALVAVALVLSWDRYAANAAAQGSPSCVAPPSGMVSWWTGDGNANDIQGSNNGTLQNGATFATGKVGQAFSLNASLNSGVSVPSSPELNPTEAITVDAWVKPASFPNAFPTVMRKDRDAGGNAQYILAVTNTGLAHCHIGNLPELFGGSVPLNQWSQLACTYDRQTIRLYVNGSEVASALATQAIPTASNNLVIGKEDGFTDRNFDGLIDEVEIFNRALAASEIQAIVNAGSAGKCKPDADGDGVTDSLDACPGTPAGTVVNAVGCPVGQCVPPPAGMVSWLPGDGNANDIKGSNNGTLMNGTTFAAGQVGQAFLLDGIDDFVELGNAPSLRVSAGDFAVDAWVRFNALSHPPGANSGAPQGDMSILDKMSPSGTNTNGWRLLKQADNHFWFCFGGGGGNGCVAGSATTVISTTPATLGAWFHVTAVKSSAEIAIYINGVKEDSKSTPAFTDTHTANLRIGSYVLEDAHLNGLIDEVEIFNRSLSALEIQAIYLAGSAGKCKNRPPVAVCQNVTVSAGANCTATASIDNGSYDPDGDAITLTQAPAGPYPLGNTSVTLTVTDSKGAASQCSAIVTVVDSTPPQITPPANASYQCLSQVPPGSPSQATATDNCSTPTITVADASNGGAGSTASPLVITRVFMAADAAGNSNNATQTITVIDNTPPTLTAPPAVNASTGAGATACGVVVSDAALGAATASDNCGSTTITRSGVPPGNFFPVGSTPITYTANDGHGNTAMATQTVTVIDNTSPAITCPAGTTVSANASCQAAVPNVLVSVTAADNCTPVGALTMTQSPAAGAPIGLGTTTITVTVSDAAGNSSTCTTTVTVVDSTPPVITACAAPQAANANANCQAALPDFTGAVTATDNCSASGALTITQSPAAGTPVGLGTTAVTLTVRDAANNTATCATGFTVTDHTNPVLSNCPSPITVYTGAGATACAATASWTPPTAADNCGTATLTSSHNPGATFPVGTTTVSYTARDAAGNQTSCSFTVTVIDNTPPVIACPANVSMFCGATVNPGVATATDNCAGVTVAGVRSDSQPLNAPYPLGTTTITWRATDAAGNQSTCQQTVMVTNPPPVATITGPATGSVYAAGTPVSFTGTFTDNAGGTHTATWTFDAITQAGTVNETTGAITGSFTFTAAGVYKVTLTVTDNCGGAHTTDVIGPDALTELVVIYDASAGWVTGGGWINSPAGAYVANPSLTGKANFAFQSKYQNGASTPDGKTEFQFKAGNLNFSSTSYEWMVIAGARAQYKGAGTINGAGDYRFMLTAIDGQEPGGGGADKFRIRIWNNAGGGLVYDNQMNAPDSADPTTLLGGGSIVIHR